MMTQTSLYYKSARCYFHGGMVALASRSLLIVWGGGKSLVSVEVGRAVIFFARGSDQ